jgi:trk system potassium uptake protein TrkA
MRIVIAGAGEVGTHLAKMLSSENHDTAVIDTREENLKDLVARFDLLTYTGSATSIAMLKSAGVARADLFIAVTSSEDANINSAILAKKLGAKRCIARIDNLEYLEHENQDNFLDLGIDYMIYPELLAATEVGNLIQSAGSSEIATFADNKIALYVFRMTEMMPILNKSLDELIALIDNPLFKIVGISRSSVTIIPQGGDQFLLNDTVYIISTRNGISTFLEYAGAEDEHIRNIMILGGSRIGRNIAKELGKKYTVKLVERDREKCYFLSNYLRNTLIINGDGTNFNLLMDEGLGNMDIFVAVTGNSETNMLASLLAKRMGVKKIIAEIENNDYIKLGENMGIDVIVNKKFIAASRIFSFTTRDDVAAVKCLTGTDSEVMEFVVKPESRVTKDKLINIEFPKDVIVAAWARGRQSFIATDETELKAFDRVVVFSLPGAIGKIGKFFS